MYIIQSAIMKSFVYSTLIVVIAALITLLITNPSESKFLNRVSHDYGAVHKRQTLNKQALLMIGESHRKSYYLFSTYSYQFGNIKVDYVGIANTTIYMGSNAAVRRNPDELQPSNIDVISI